MHVIHTHLACRRSWQCSKRHFGKSRWALGCSCTCKNKQRCGQLYGCDTAPLSCLSYMRMGRRSGTIITRLAQLQAISSVPCIANSSANRSVECFSACRWPATIQDSRGRCGTGSLRLHGRRCYRHRQHEKHEESMHRSLLTELIRCSLGVTTAEFPLSALSSRFLAIAVAECEAWQCGPLSYMSGRHQWHEMPSHSHSNGRTHTLWGAACVAQHAIASLRCSNKTFSAFETLSLVCWQTRGVGVTRGCFTG